MLHKANCSSSVFRDRQIISNCWLLRHMKLLYDYKNGSPEGCGVKSLGNIYGVEVNQYKRNIEVRVLHAGRCQHSGVAARTAVESYCSGAVASQLTRCEAWVSHSASLNPVCEELTVTGGSHILHCGAVLPYSQKSSTVLHTTVLAHTGTHRDRYTHMYKHD